MRDFRQNGDDTINMRGDSHEAQKYGPPKYVPKVEDPNRPQRPHRPHPVMPKRLAVEEDLAPDTEIPSTPLSGVLFDAQRPPSQRRRIPRGGLSFTPDLPPARTILGSIRPSRGRDEAIARAVSEVWSFGRGDRYGIRF